MNVTVRDLLRVSNAVMLCGSEDGVISNCFVDSRKKISDGCFFGIKGKNSDGSLFYKEAIKNGAKTCVLSNKFNYEKIPEVTIVLVDDVLLALQKIAAYKRSLFKGPLVTVTGSVGKTSTKNVLASILSQNHKVLKTNGNENSQVGLPLTILRLKDEDVMVLEMGMSNKGEIHKLSMIAKPNVAIITNVFDSHIGNLKTKENILKAKMEILDGMDEGYLIINNDNDMLRKVNEEVKPLIKVMSFGIENKSNVMASNIKEDVKTTFDIDDVKDLSMVGGKALVYNVLAAYLASKLLGVSRSMIKKGINEVEAEKHRLNTIMLNDNITVIDDSYNASYDSVKASLEYVKNFDGKKIIILGDILELGKKTKLIHKKIGRLVAKEKPYFLVTIGKCSKYINKEAKKLGMKKKNMKHFKSEVKSRKFVKSLIRKDMVLLIKGSNGNGLCNLVNYLLS